MNVAGAEDASINELARLESAVGVPRTLASIDLDRELLPHSRMMPSP